VSARFLDDAAQAAFRRAIETIEAASAVEVVVAVRRRSASYLHVNAIVGFIAAFAGLAFAMYSDRAFSHLTILLDPFVVGLVTAGLVQALPGLKRLATPHARRHAHVLRNARATFVERGVHNTIDRSGILIYISWLEQEVVIVADTGALTHLSLPTLAVFESAMSNAMPKGGEAVAHKLGELASHAARAMPRRAGDTNELPDTVDHDLHGARA